MQYPLISYKMIAMNKKNLHNSRLELIFEKKIPGLRVTEALRHQEFIMRQRHVHATIELFFLIEGNRFMFVDRETYRLQAGSAMLVNHDLIHKTSVATGSPPDHRNFILQLDRTVFDGLLRQLGYPGFDEFGSIYTGVANFTEPEWKLVLHIISAFKAACNQDFGKTDRNPELNSFLILQAMELLGLFVRARRNEQSEIYKKKDRNVVESGVHRKVHDIAMYIQNNSHENISLDELAEKFYMSKSYLTRIFRNVTGFSVVEYNRFIKVKKAQDLLRGTELSITDIAAQTGFGNITYFEKVFKQTTGQSPAQYRKHQGE